MAVKLGFSRDNPTQAYAADILAITPNRKKADLVARAIYFYLGGKEYDADGLSILLTGKPRKYRKKSASRKRILASPNEPIADAAETIQHEEQVDEKPVRENAPEQEPQPELEIPSTEGQMKDTEDSFTAADTSMLNDIMAAFQGQ